MLNARRYLESDASDGQGSDAHKAAVVGDTVGDPFKDTAGPSLHVLIKMLATITMVLALLFIYGAPTIFFFILFFSFFFT